MPYPRASRPSASLLCALGLALGAEAAALLLVAADQVLPALGWHLIAALSCAFAGHRAARGTPEARPELAAIVAGSLVVTLPGVGLLGLVWVVLPHLASRRAIAGHVLTLERPPFHEHESVAFDTERGFAAHEDELAPDHPLEQRVQSVMALRRMDPELEFGQGDGHTLNLEQAGRWAEAALGAHFDGTTAVVLARVRLKRNEPEAAWQLIVAAERAGVASGVCAPLLAEAAFLMRKFDAIPRLLARVADDPMHSAQFDAVARFWTGRSAS